ncbi:squalene/phytoene synthase family protein [Demequina capsici]|uniref:Squalene/phytoene synthase family protein n=1 Tax=Demequina capsici TaxID=3075620 RepID=A0AA96FCP0_9MICO|nr:squalene/phytoene synthase family protein [Demequina sp. PMTSA13]WNM27383.1 squalene/phytoene synthase family protein [Demequina sp. PMTSA13]
MNDADARPPADVPDTDLALYDRTAHDAASQVIARYSTSFGTGTRLLPKAMRGHIEDVYAMVRVADEIVDTYRGPDAGELLDAFEREVHAALDRGFSTNLVAHAFGRTAAQVGITRAQTEPFFASMRMDLERTVHTPETFAAYVHGSAEVIGEMCLAVFLNSSEGPRPLPPTAAEGARRLGAAYQKVNFLRDLGADESALGRSYFPGVTAHTLDDARLAALVADCRADVHAAERCMPALPRRARIAVGTTIDIYLRLLDRIAVTPAARLSAQRVRVPDSMKLALALRNTVTRRRARVERSAQ